MILCNVEKRKSLIDQDGKTLELTYGIATDIVETGGFSLETYGIGIYSLQEGVMSFEVVPDISSSKSKVIAMLNLMFENDVTPISLRDIICDCIDN